MGLFRLVHTGAHLCVFQVAGILGSFPLVYTGAHLCVFQVAGICAH
jgi:hypothetical protein